jgi:phosphoglycerate kinase
MESLQTSALSYISKLWEKEIKRGETWVYSAGFNTPGNSKDMNRIDVELRDLKYLVSKGARISILSHQGEFGNALHLDYVARYLEKKLGHKVDYYPESIGNGAVNRKNEMKDGEIVLFGNTRFYEGEEKGSRELAGEFSKLGEFVAIGGFSKAHRKHASNYMILEHIPGYFTYSFIKELVFLEQLNYNPDYETRVALLGGVKKEKILYGLPYFVKNYDLVIPGGIVLNTILMVMGFNIGASYVGKDTRETTKMVETILQNDAYNKKIVLPAELIITLKNGGNRRIKLGESSLPSDNKFAIVDFVINNNSFSRIPAANKLKIVIAGTPSMISKGYNKSMKSFNEIIKRYQVNLFLLGGDTSNDIKMKCSGKSSGGGSALYYLCKNTIPLMAS